MSDTEYRKLTDLKVVELRAELEKRGLDKNGIKSALLERLQKVCNIVRNYPYSFVFVYPVVKLHSICDVVLISQVSVQIT